MGSGAVVGEARAEGSAPARGMQGPAPACIEPFVVRLPRVTVHLGRVVVRLPKARIQVVVRMVDGKLQMPSEGELRRLIAEAPWTPVETVVEPPTTTITPVEVEAIPPTDAVRPICVQADFGSLALSARMDPAGPRATGDRHAGAKST